MTFSPFCGKYLFVQRHTLSSDTLPLPGESDLLLFSSTSLKTDIPWNFSVIKVLEPRVDIGRHVRKRINDLFGGNEMFSLNLVEPKVSSYRQPFCLVLETSFWIETIHFDDSDWARCHLLQFSRKIGEMRFWISFSPGRNTHTRRGTHRITPSVRRLLRYQVMVSGR